MERGECLSAQKSRMEELGSNMHEIRAVKI